MTCCLKGCSTVSLGGLLLLLLRPWLARAGRRWEGVAYGALLLIGAGTAIITSDNDDFERIGVPWLNVLMFAALFIGFGPLIVAVARRLDRALPTLSFQQVWPPGRFLGSVLIFVVGGVTLLPLTLLLIASPLTVISITVDMLRQDSLAGIAREIVTVLSFGVLLVVLPLARIARTPQVAPLAARHPSIAALNGQRTSLVSTWHSPLSSSLAVC